ncbi:uncharacterized protein FFNC_15396 [Fusarium fujikuroi]|nr:uncharacterized protein FFNC_15396 [Fusarium fujikuroi]
MASVQRVAKDQGYGVVKLRASNYRDGKPTRYDLVCDRGGVKYNSTAKKRNPSTRKIDCPFRAKAGLMRIEQRLDNIEKRMDTLEARAGGGYEPRLQAIEERLQEMEGPRMDGMGIGSVQIRLLASTVM